MTPLLTEELEIFYSNLPLRCNRNAHGDNEEKQYSTRINLRKSSHISVQTESQVYAEISIKTLKI